MMKYLLFFVLTVAAFAGPITDEHVGKTAGPADDDYSIVHKTGSAVLAEKPEMRITKVEIPQERFLSVTSQVASQVPETGTWAMVLLGLGVGAWKRR